MPIMTRDSLLEIVDQELNHLSRTVSALGVDAAHFAFDGDDGRNSVVFVVNGLDQEHLDLLIAHFNRFPELCGGSSDDMTDDILAD